MLLIQYFLNITFATVKNLFKKIERKELVFNAADLKSEARLKIAYFVMLYCLNLGYEIPLMFC